MRSVELGTPVSTHGIQCAIGTLIASKLYAKILNTEPDKEKALAFADSFDFGKWSEELRAFLGNGAEVMIAAEKKDGKYDKTKHTVRLDIIIDNFEKIKDIIREEIPTPDKISDILDLIGCPKTAKEIGIDEAILPMTFKATKDIRDKYVLSRLCWDLGIQDELAEMVK
jgi:glycerol-1-phosphate dehydrogenase [NAD(P)+]